MSGFTFDFDLEDDLDESFDAIPLQEPATAPSISKNKTLALEHHEPKPGTEIPAEEIPLSALVRLSFSSVRGPRLMYGRQCSSPRSPRRSRTLP
jgi:hypothetical protein